MAKKVSTRAAIIIIILVGGYFYLFLSLSILIAYRTMLHHNPPPRSLVSPLYLEHVGLAFSLRLFLFYFFGLSILVGGYFIFIFGLAAIFILFFWPWYFSCSFGGYYFFIFWGQLFFKKKLVLVF